MGRGVSGKQFSVLVVLLLVGLLLASLSYGIITSDTANATFDFPANETYSNNANGNFSITYSGENGTYRAELIFNSTGYGYLNLTNAVNNSMAANASVPDGVNYTVYWNITNGTESNVSQNITLTIDTTNPAVNISDGTFTNGSQQTATALLFNTTLSDTNFVNVSFYLYNASASKQLINETRFNGTGTTFMNFTGLGDGNYSVNVTAWDRATNKNVTNIYSAIVDTTAPSVEANASATSIAATASITLSCTVADLLDPEPSSAITVKYPDSSTFVSATSSFSDTNLAGTYTVRCTAEDWVQNSATADTTFEVVGKESGSSDDDDSDSSSSTSDEEEEDGEEEESKEPEKDENGVVDLSDDEDWVEDRAVSYTGVAEGDEYSFAFVSDTGEEEEHMISISEVNEEEGYVVFLVESEVQEVQVAVGESEEVDLNEDGFSDLKITLNSITDGEADVTFEQIGEWDVPAVEEEEASSYTWLLVLILVLLALAGVIYYVREKM